MMEMRYADKNPCACPRCQTVVHHWFCSSCGGGPYDVRTHPWFFRQQLPPSADVRTHLSPDIYYFCSPGCQLAIARDNEQREAVAAGKWATVGAARSPSDSKRDQSGGAD